MQLLHEDQEEGICLNIKNWFGGKFCGASGSSSVLFASGRVMLPQDDCQQVFKSSNYHLSIKLL